MLTQAEFETAVKEALRHYTQADILARSPLLQTRLMARGAEAGGVQELRQMLAQTVETLFAGGRDQKLHRVLDLTYLHPAPKQEAAAERLGLPFSTYRRHLTMGVDRVTAWLWQQEQEAGGALTEARASAPADALPRLSVVVLPFLNLSQDSSLDYLVDGIVDNLITDLSRAVPGSFVISRSTAFTYKGRRVPVRQIGEELKVRMVLEGSVLADETQLRVNAQLVDARTDEHLWAERFDKERRDILQLQDEIVARLARSVGIEMLRNEAARSRGAQQADAVDLVMRGNALAVDLRQREKAEEAVSLFRQALALDAGNVNALVGIALTRIFQRLNLFCSDENRRLLDEAETLLSRAFALEPDHIGVLKAHAVLLRARGRFAEAAAATAAVMERNPGEPTAYREMGLNKLYLGLPEEAVEWFHRADRIAPRDPARWTWLQGLGRALMQLELYEEAVRALRLAVEGNPNWTPGIALLAAAEAQAGNLAQARLQLAEFAAAEPGMTIARFSIERSSVPLDAVSPAYLRANERILEGLRRAGMQEG